jgi:flagellar FliL protein
MAESDNMEQGRRVMINQKVLIFGCVAVVLCAVITMMAAFMALKNGANSAGGNNQQTNIAAQIGPLFELGDITTNLASGGDNKYVKVKVVFEMSDKSLEKEINEKLPVLSDRIIVLLNSKVSDDLSAKNRTKLKNEILSDINPILNTGELKDVYFSDLVLQ